MSQVIFTYQSIETIIQCKTTEKLKDICHRYATKIKIDIDNLYFIYNGNIINKELINEEDKKRNTMNILVIEINKTLKNDKIIRSKDIICPKYYEEILMSIKDYKINLYSCLNGHKFNEILLNDFENTQKINISNIICDICKIYNKGNIYNNELYRCLTCHKNLCPLCKSKHEKNHKIILYELKNYLCEEHKENFTRFCKNCNKNICMKCEKKHKNHNTFYLGDMLPNDNIIDEIKELKEYIEKFNNDIKDIIQKLQSIIDNIQLYYNLSYNIIIAQENRNYQKLQNINELINYNNIILKDIKKIINNNNILDKMKTLLNIYNKMNNKSGNYSLDDNTNDKNYLINSDETNYIISEIEIKEEDLNKEVRIINSFEQCKREYKWEDNKEDYKFENEKEIKDKYKIIINNEKIPFSYFYKFNKIGKNIIKYYFVDNLINAYGLFRSCEKITYINLSHFNAKNVKLMTCTFGWCKSLKDINLSNCNTENVISMEEMFICCKSLKNLDLSH